MSRSLPARANLDHLKNEAKALLKTLRAHDAGVKLTDAQRQLAREYGFPTWAKLRAHVAAARATDDSGLTDFLTAIQEQNREAATRVLERYPELPGRSLHVAAAIGSTADVQRLSSDATAVRTKAGALPAEPLLYLCFSPFHGESAERDGQLLASATHLLAAGADPNTKDSRYGVPALYGVTGMHNSPAIARLLLEAGANPTDGESVFHAAERFNIEALELLRDFGVRLNEKGDWGNTPLYFVLRYQDTTRDEHAAMGVEWLLANGADPNVACGGERENSLHVAAR